MGLPATEQEQQQPDRRENEHGDSESSDQPLPKSVVGEEARRGDPHERTATSAMASTPAMTR